MKKIVNLSVAALCMIVGGFLNSCSQDDVMAPNVSGNVLVKAPKIVATSGDVVIGSNAVDSRSVDEVSEMPPHFTGDDMNTVRKMMEKIDEHINGNYSGKLEGVTLYNGFYDFNTQWLKDGKDFYVVNVVNGSVGEIVTCDVRFWHEDIAYDITEDTYNNGDFTTLSYVDCLLQFESDNPQTHIEKEIEDISFNEYNGFVFATNPLYNNKDKNDYNKSGNYPPFRYMTIDGLEGDDDWEYAYIACYWQKSAEYSPNSPGTEKGDNIWDRVIRIAKRKEAPKNEENEEVAGHNHSNEVEVNLHGVERKEGQLESHLSLHLRYAGDVEVFIPVPATYTCEADDLDIVMKHEANHMVHSSTFTLKDSAISPYGELTVSVTVAYEEGGIRITTHGVTEDVIAWCGEKFDGDGITFEIWNYYNDPEKLGDVLGISYDDLMYLLNKATIKFLGDELPETYINSFGKDVSSIEYNADCTVTIVEEQVGEYNNGTPGSHLNGSENNMIYEKKESK